MLEDDILNVGKLWIGGRCYRNYDTYENVICEESTVELKDSQLPEMINEEPCDLGYNIQVSNNGRFFLEMPVPSEFFGILIGRRGTTKQRIETDSMARIEIPRQNQTNSPLIISGSTRGDVIRAKVMIDNIVNNARRKMNITHFISIPMNSDEIRANWIKFKVRYLQKCCFLLRFDDFLWKYPLAASCNIVLEYEFVDHHLLNICDFVVTYFDVSGCVESILTKIQPFNSKEEVLEHCSSSRGVVSQLFDHSIKLHLTISVLTLLNQNERELAKKKFEEAVEVAVRPKMRDELRTLELCGLDIMNDDPSETRVLYTKVKDPEYLQELVDAVNKKIQETGLTREKTDSIKMHVTLMNIRNLMRGETPTKGSWPTFDSTEILRKFKDYYFGRQYFDQMHLSIIGSSTEDEYYKASIIIKI